MLWHAHDLHEAFIQWPCPPTQVGNHVLDARAAKGNRRARANQRKTSLLLQEYHDRRQQLKSTGSPAPQWGRPDRPAALSDGGSGRPSPICFRCGKRGHISSKCTNARPSPICFRCGKRGHLSSTCTNAPLPKRNEATDSASVVFDMTPWADEFAAWFSGHAHSTAVAETAPGMLSGSDAAVADEDANALEETKGCALLDDGTTVMCSSTLAAEEMQMQRLHQHEPGLPSVTEADRRFLRFADGRIDEAQQWLNNRSHQA